MEVDMHDGDMPTYASGSTKLLTFAYAYGTHELGRELRNHETNLAEILAAAEKGACNTDETPLR